MNASDKGHIIKPGSLVWRDDEPLSDEYGDVYFSRANGLAESRHVFISQNLLPERWESPTHCKPFVIVETGFGTGLNFLATWQAWLALDTPDKPDLHFISVEKHPLTLKDLKRANALWPELSGLNEQLLKQYPHLIPGQHSLTFENGKVQLSLLFGDVNEILEHCAFIADAWYLDGFAPSKNSEMWSDTLFQLMKRRSRNTATFSTFTAAGFVRRGLMQHGFSVSKVPGFGSKREMLCGTFKTLSELSHPLKETAAPKQIHRWALSSFPPQTLNAGKETSNHASAQTPQTPKFDVAIVGAGLAGVTTALALSRKGLRVALIDKNKPLSGASGQSQLALFAKFPAKPNRESRFTTRFLSHAQTYWQAMQESLPSAQFWHSCGLIQLAWNSEEKQRQSRFLAENSFPASFLRGLTPEEASEQSGFKLDHSGILFSKSGWLAPQLWLEATQLALPHVTTYHNKAITELEPISTTHQWRLKSNDGDILATHVVVACGHHAREFSQLAQLPLKPIRGQTSSIPAREAPAVQTVICGEGYLCPAHSGQHSFGATYDLKSTNTSTTHEDDQKNIASICHWLPGWLTPSAASKVQAGSSGLRCTTPDYFPLVGYAPDYEQMMREFSDARQGVKK